MRRAGLLLGILLSACAKDPDPFVISVRAPIGETPFGGSPAVTSVELRVRDAAGSEKALGRVTAASGSIELPESGKTGIGAIVLAGLGSDGALLSYGRTPLMDLSALTDPPSVTIALMVQRLGAAPPAFPLTSAPSRPRCASLAARYLIVADAASTSADVLDLLDLVVQREAPFPAAPTTLASTLNVTLALDAAGNATLLDLDAGTQTTPTAPAGSTFAEVNGGAVVADDTGAWIVGPARADAASDLVMHVASDGTLVARRLSKPRKNAAAAWIAGRGLLVAYGEGDAPGLELVTIDAGSPAALPFVGDGKPAGVLATLDGTRVLRIDPDGVGTVLDLSCASACAPQATPLREPASGPRADDHATRAETGSLVTRGGKVSFVPSDASKLVPLFDAGSQPVCSAALSTGAVGIAVGGEASLRMFAPPR